MNLSDGHMMLFVISMSLMLFQLTVREKQFAHILFAMFCGSVAMLTAQKLSVDAVGPYHYIIGMFGCFTCNSAWLFARAMFRPKRPFAWYHLFVALLIACLISGIQGLNFYGAVNGETSTSINNLQVISGELLGLLSSSILALTFWEGCRGWSEADRTEKRQRLTFLIAYSLCVSSVMFLSKVLPAEMYGGNTRDWLACMASITILFTSQVLLIWRYSPAKSSAHNTEAVTASMTDESMILGEDDKRLAQELNQYLHQQKAYLQTNLKVSVLAQYFQVSEYRISRVLKQHFKASNFNNYINLLRVEHAKSLLSDPSNAHWSVLVVGLESGFASVGPFTRAFKAAEGCTPGQYRKTMSHPVKAHC